MQALGFFLAIAAVAGGCLRSQADLVSRQAALLT